MSVGCSGVENCVDDGESVVNAERSGVTVRDIEACGRNAVVCWLATGVDQENVGAGFAAGRFAAFVSVGAAAEVLTLPCTNRSKSASAVSEDPFVDGNADMVPNDIMSVELDVGLLPPSSFSFFVCSTSTRVDKVLMSSMNSRNCCKFKRGPRLILHRIGRTSMARYSVSTTLPICRRTFRAARMTAGSFVLIARISGTIFSWIVYLSRALAGVFFLDSTAIPSKPSLLASASELPPASMTKASRPLTLIARLLVLLKTEAMTGNSSFLMVLKSSTGRTVGKDLRPASTSGGVGDSMARMMMGRTSS